MSYLIRCIDNKNDKLYSEEESIDNLDPIINQYKKDKADAIKPLYELLDDERKNILSQAFNFYSLTTENKKFQNLLLLCREDINRMSMVHGQKKDEIIEEYGEEYFDLFVYYLKNFRDIIESKKARNKKKLKIKIQKNN